MSEERKVRTEQEIIVDDAFEWDGYQVVRREFFSHTFEPSLKFDYNSITFSTACIKKFPDTMFVQVLVNQKTKQLIVKACGEDERGALRWCTVNKKTGKRQVREIKGVIFTGKIFDMMGWNINYRYKSLGTVVSVREERIIVFKLEDCETYTPIERNEDGSAKRMGRKAHYPSAWKDSFGLPLEEHMSQLKIDVLDDFARFEVVKPKTVTPTTKAQPEPIKDRLDIFDGGGGDGNK